MLQPDDEVVEVFSGDTLEEAMANAVAALGPELSVRRARKVRKGMQGLMGKDRFEVLALPAPRADGDALEDAFDALLSRAEEAEEERVPARRTGESVAEQHPHPAPLVAAHFTPPPTPARSTRRRPAPAPATDPEPDVVPVPVPRAARSAPEPLLLEPEPERPAPAPRGKRGTGWSRTALQRLGVPKSVLQALPQDDPGDDLAWLTAVAAAIATVLPAPQAPGPACPLVVSGHGLAGALAMLKAAADGLVPGTLTTGDRTAPATPLELALVLRSAVTGWPA